MNLGGATRVDLSAVARELEGRSLRSVRSVLNSGNLLLESERSAESVATLVQEVVTATAGRAATVVVRGPASFDRLVESNPFVSEAETHPGLVTVAFLQRRPTAAAWTGVRGPWPGGERVVPFDDEAFVLYPQGQGRSKLSVRLLERLLGVALTVRNWNTVRRLDGLLRHGWE